MRYAAPSASVEVSFNEGTTGLVGTAGVCIVDGQGATTTARVTTGIVETPAGSGHYVATVTAPATAGTYVVVFDDGAGTPTYLGEDLTVTYSAPGAASPSGSDLTTVAAVREFLQKDDADVEQDEVIQSLITRASLAIMQYTNREFAPATASATRSFYYYGEGLLNLAPYDLRSVTSLQIDTETASPTTLVADTDYFLYPLPAKNGVYSWIEFDGYGLASGRNRRRVTIAGAWGFAAVPEDVAHAAIVTVAIWMRRDVSAFSTTFNMDDGRLERPEALPSSVRGTLAAYRLASVG